MFSISFWKSWPPVFQRLFWLVSGILIFSILFLWFSYFRSPAPALTWQRVMEQAAVEVPAHNFSVGIFDITVLADSYVLFERFVGNPLAPQPVAAWFFLMVLVLSATVMVAIITTLARFWYAVGMGLFILFVVGFRLELIQVFGLINKIPAIVILAIYLPVSFYFHAFNTAATFLRRFLVFLALTAVTGAILILFARAPHPGAQLAATGYAAGIILTILYIIMVSHEILASFITLLTRGTRQSKSLNHFMIISAIYLLNLFLAYANKNRWIEWDFMVINLYLLFTVSGILGIWGFRQREAQYNNILAADPLGIYFIVSLASIAFTTIAWLVTAANDAALETVRDAIIYCHLGYGIIFILYVVSNFGGMLAENVQVFKVLYKPTRMPYFTFRFAGLITTLAFVFYNTWQVPVHNAQSGFFNAQGDVFKQDHPKLAEAYYARAGLYGFRNHHSNYATADIAAAAGDTEKEKSYYKRASGNRPTEMSFLNWSQQLQREHNWHQAIKALREGLHEFPRSGAIQNTLGLVYANLSATDSALFFLQAASAQSMTAEAAAGNAIAIAALYNLDLEADSLYQNAGAKVQGNALAFANRKEMSVDAQAPDLSDTVLNNRSAIHIGNYLINKTKPDTAFINQVIDLVRKPVNEDFREPLSFACALAHYRLGSVSRAFQLLEGVVYFSETPGKYNNVLAQWCLEQGAPEKALEFLDYALAQGYRRAALTNAVALVEAGRTREALVAWDTLKIAGDSAQLQLAESIQRVLVATPDLLTRMSDAEKYEFARTRVDAFDSVSFNNTLRAITSDDYKARAILDRSKKLFEWDEVAAAVQSFSAVRGLRLREKKLFDEIQVFDLKLVAGRGDAETLQKRMAQLQFTPGQENDRLYFETLLAADAGDFALTNRNFQYLSGANPFFEEAVTAAADFFRDNEKQELKAYNILADALHANPGAVRLLKAYSIEAARAGFSEFAANALLRLQSRISRQSFSKFIADNRELLAPLVQTSK